MVFRAGAGGGEAGAGDEALDVQPEGVYGAEEVEAGAVERDVGYLEVASVLACPLEGIPGYQADGIVPGDIGMNLIAQIFTLPILYMLQRKRLPLGTAMSLSVTRL